MSESRLIVRSVRALRRSERAIRPELAIDTQPRVVEIKRQVREAEQFAAADASGRCEPPEREQAMVGHVLAESAEFASRPRLNAGAGRHWRVGAGRWVAGQRDQRAASCNAQRIAEWISRRVHRKASSIQFGIEHVQTGRR